jgi:mannose-P-dolichol utilization defect 1
VLAGLTREQRCYESLVENFDLGDGECIKYSISKALGVAIVLGGSIMKVPQLLLSRPFLPPLRVE